MKNKSEESILSIASAFRKSKILLSAIELGIFSLIGHRELNSKDVAYELNTDENATERMLNALASIGLLDKSRQHFRNTSESLRYLDKNSSEYIGSLLHMNLNWDSWGKLTEVVKSGKSIYNNLFEERSDEFVEAYINSVHHSYLHEAKGVAESITLKNVKRMMDLGCGSGFYSIEFLKKNPLMKVIFYDYPKVIKQTEKYLEEANIDDNNYSLVSGQIKDASFEDDLDLIYASFIFEEFSIWDNIEIMKNCYNSLNPNGRLIIHENLINNDRTSPVDSVLYSLNLKLHTEKGDTYTENDYWIMLKEAGFQQVDNLVTEYGTILIRGTKKY